MAESNFIDVNFVTRLLLGIRVIIPSTKSMIILYEMHLKKTSVLTDKLFNKNSYLREFNRKLNNKNI
jgi:hypothetical protein